MNSIGEALYHLHWMACDDEGYVGDWEGAQGIIARMPVANGVTGESIRNLVEAVYPYADYETYDVGGTDLCVWETPRFKRGQDYEYFHVIWYSPSLDTDDTVYLLTTNEVEKIIMQANEIILECPEEVRMT